jgi:hypothetical protein
MGPFTFQHIKRLRAGREQILASMLRGDRDFPALRLGAVTAFLIYALVIVDFFLRHQPYIAALLTIVVLFLWVVIVISTRKQFRT